MDGQEISLVDDFTTVDSAQRSHEQLLEAILDCTAVVVDVVAPAECLDMLYIKMIPIG